MQGYAFTAIDQHRICVRHNNKGKKKRKKKGRISIYAEQACHLPNQAKKKKKEGISLAIVALFFVVIIVMKSELESLTKSLGVFEKLEEGE